MHFLMFRFKRAHLRSLAIARKLAKELQGLTPARYDIMYALSHGAECQMLQCDLWRALGISRAAVSVMVRRLMALGFLRRWRSLADKRTFVVAFTTEGAEAMRLAYLFLNHHRTLRVLYERAFGDDPALSDIAAKNLDWAVNRVARYFRDTSWSLYPTRAPTDA